MSALGFHQSPRGWSPSSLFIFPFLQMDQRSGQHPLSWGAGCGWGPLPGLRREGWDRLCLCLLSEPAAASAQPAQLQEQGGCDPEDAGVRAHDALLGVLGGGSPLRAPQPTREREQQRDPCVPRAEAQGRTLLPGSWEPGPWERAGGADAKGSFHLEPHSLHVQDGSGLCSASLPPGALGEMRAFGECSRGLGMSLDSWFPRPSSASVPGACSLDGPCIRGYPR